MTAPPTLETERCVLTVLRPEHAHLLLAYRQRNAAHLAPWEPTRSADDGTPLDQACYLGYSVDQEWQGQGLMREVVQAGMDYVFGTLGLHRIMANHMPSNVRSERLLRSLGFEREGYARAYLQIAGRWEDMVLNALVNPQS